MIKPVSFFSILKAEHFKTRRNVGILILLLFPIAITLALDINIAYDSIGETIESFSNPWTIVFGRGLFSFYSLIYPLALSIFCYSLCDMEYKQQSFKQLFTLPISKLQIFTSKIVLLIEVVLLSTLVAYLSFMLSGNLLGYLFPQLHFQDYDVRLITAVFFCKLFICSLTITLIQYSISLLFKNFVIPIGFASFCLIASALAGEWKYIYLVPYHSIMSANIKFVYESVTFLGKEEYANLFYIGLFIILSFYIFRKIKI